MEAIAGTVPAGVWSYVLAVALLAGMVKGTVGFAMPMILISGLGSVVAPETALAGLILPTLVTNLWQALRQGAEAALASLHKFRRFLLAGFVCLMASAQLVRWLPQGVMLLIIGAPIALYALSALAGRLLRLPPDPGPRLQVTVGAAAGLMGGISGVWGPPTVAMLIAQGAGKAEHVRVQGVVYGLGSVALMAAHLGSGVLNGRTLPLSLGLAVPALAGMAIGLWIQDRIDHAMFRRLTLLVLLIAGANLIRRGFAVM